MKTFIYKLLLFLALSTLVEANYFETNQANVWSSQGSQEGFRSYSLGYGYVWSHAVTEESEYFNISDFMGYDNIQIPHTEQSFFLLNNFNASYPKVNETYVRLSLSGLDAPNSDSYGDSQPIVSLVPGDMHNLNETTALRFFVQKAEGDDSPLLLNYSISSSVDGVQSYKILYDDNSYFEKNSTIYLIKNADYNVTFSVNQDARSSQEYRQEYTLYSDVNFRRDSDSDGFPDLWEAEHGLDPLVDSRQVDSDGDGWSDADEALRGSNPFDATGAPRDSDGDGWSDYDEEVRFTDYNESTLPNCSQRPTASSLYGAEYNVSGLIDTTYAYALKVYTVAGEAQFNSDAPNAVLDQNLTGKPDCNVSVSEIESALSVQKVPNARFSASDSMVSAVRSSKVHFNKTYRGKYVLKSYIPSKADADISQVTQWLEDQDLAWQSVADWENGVKAYLSTHLLYNQEVNVTAQSSIDVAVLEAAIAYDEDLDFTQRSLVLLGKDTLSLESRSTWLRDVNTYRLSINALFEDIKLMHASANEELEKVFFGLETIMSEYELNTQDSDVLLAQAIQKRSWSQDYFIYVLRLIHYIPFESTETNPFDFNYDSDGDGVSNYNELLALGTSNPFDADSDDDGLNDAVDPCLLSANNNCLNEENLDSDGDSILDGFDNCPARSNVKQLDSDGNGVGDACELDSAFVITWPRRDMTVVLGEGVQFRLQETQLATGEVVSNESILWSDNAINIDTGMEPDVFRFNSLGAHTVCVHVPLAASTLEQCRSVMVVGSNSNGPTILVPSDVVAMERTASENSTVIIELERSGDLSKESSFQVNRHLDALITPADLNDVGIYTTHVKFLPQQVFAYIRVEIVADSLHEDDELFSLSFQDAVGIGSFSANEINVSIVDDESNPSVSFLTDLSSVNEDEGTYNLGISLSEVSTQTVSGEVVLVASSATLGSDFNFTGTFSIAAGENLTQVVLNVDNDTLFEDTEYVELVLSALNNAEEGLYESVYIEILDDDAKDYAIAINDSNILTCASETNNSASCSLSGFPNQDATHGRDIILTDDSDGLKGFEFIKMTNEGDVLANQSDTNHTCVYDSTTKLMWRVPLVADYDTLYTWHDSNNSNNGGDSGYGDFTPTTKNLVDASNSDGLCALNHWRVPTRQELFDIMSLDDVAYMQGAYFPYINNTSYWTADTDLNQTTNAYVIGLDTWEFTTINKNQGWRSLILVSDTN